MRATRAALVVAAVAFAPLVAVAHPGAVAAQGAPSTSTTRPATTTTSTKTSTSAVATTATPSSTAPATTASTAVSTTATSTTSTTASTLPPPPPVENSRFPARLVASVPPVEAAPELVMNALYVTASEDGQAPDVVVHFKAPFTLPAGRYQVALSVGDPTGQRARATFVSNGPSSQPVGTVEIGDGSTWTNSAPTKVQHDPSGFVVIRMPLAATPAGGAVWAEITTGSSATPTVRTPFFDRTAFFGTADAGTLPASRFGHVTKADGTATTDVASLEEGPVVTVHGEKIYVKYSEAPLTALLGQPVQSAVDLVRIVPNFDTGGTTGAYIRIDRTAGTATLFDGTGPTPVDKSGDRSWVVRGPDGPPGPTTLVFDLSRAAQQLDIPVAADRTGVGLTRQYVLGDGRVVTAEGVLATSAWLDLAPAPLGAGPAGTAPVAAGGAVASEDRRPLLAAAAVGGVVLLVLVLVLLVRRRRRRREDAAVAAAMAERASAGDRVPWARDDSQLTQELDRVVIPGTAENSLLPAPEVETAPAMREAAPAAREAAPAPEAEPPPSVGHAGPVPWRSGSTAGHPVVGADDDLIGLGHDQAAAAGGPAAPLEAGPAAVDEVVVADVPVDRRRRRASGVVIAGTPVGSGASRGAPDHEPPVGEEPAWADADQLAGPVDPDQVDSDQVDPDQVDPDQVDPDQVDRSEEDPNVIDPGDALAVLDQDLGSFRSILRPEPGESGTPAGDP